jgi:hypothetical protein
LDWKPGEQVYEAMSLEVFFRESKIGNPKSKMAGAFGNRFRARRGLGCGSRAAAE